MSGKLDLINREELLNTLLKSGAIGGFGEYLIKKAPAVYAVPVVHGNWIELGFSTDEPYGFICSICHNDVAASKKIPITVFKYCPSCGAKMDLKDGDNCAAPAIDPVHAAGGCYCRECKYFVEHDNHTDTFCKKGVVLFRIKETDFCSYGKMRTDERG